MARQNRAIFGIYRDGKGVERAVGILQGMGVRNADISLLFPESEGAKNFAIQAGGTSPEGTAAGAVAGGALGSLVGIGVFALPGLGSFLVAGPIVGALAGVAPGLASVLLSLGMSACEANTYEEQIRRGGILMSVHCDRPDWAKRAMQILQETGAADIASGAEANADVVEVEADKPLLRHITHRSKRLRSMWKDRPLSALRAGRKSRGLVRVDRLWKRARLVTEAIRRSNRNTMALGNIQAKNFAKEGSALALPA